MPPREEHSQNLLPLGSCGNLNGWTHSRWVLSLRRREDSRSRGLSAAGRELPEGPRLASIEFTRTGVHVSVLLNSTKMNPQATSEPNETAQGRLSVSHDAAFLGILRVVASPVRPGKAPEGEKLESIRTSSLQWTADSSPTTLDPGCLGETGTVSGSSKKQGHPGATSDGGPPGNLLC